MCRCDKEPTEWLVTAAYIDGIKEKCHIGVSSDGCILLGIDDIWYLVRRETIILPICVRFGQALNYIDADLIVKLKAKYKEENGKAIASVVATSAVCNRLNMVCNSEILWSTVTINGRSGVRCYILVNPESVELQYERIISYVVGAGIRLYGYWELYDNTGNAGLWGLALCLYT